MNVYSVKAIIDSGDLKIFSYIVLGEDQDKAIANFKKSQSYFKMKGEFTKFIIGNHTYNEVGWNVISFSDMESPLILYAGTSEKAAYWNSVFQYDVKEFT